MGKNRNKISKINKFPASHLKKRKMKSILKQKRFRIVVHQLKKECKTQTIRIVNLEKENLELLQKNTQLELSNKELQQDLADQKKKFFDLSIDYNADKELLAALNQNFENIFTQSLHLTESLGYCKTLKNKIRQNKSPSFDTGRQPRNPRGVNKVHPMVQGISIHKPVIILTRYNHNKIKDHSSSSSSTRNTDTATTSRFTSVCASHSSGSFTSTITTSSVSSSITKSSPSGRKILLNNNSISSALVSLASAVPTVVVERLALPLPSIREGVIGNERNLSSDSQRNAQLRNNRTDKVLSVLLSHLPPHLLPDSAFSDEKGSVVKHGICKRKSNSVDACNNNKRLKRTEDRRSPLEGCSWMYSACITNHNEEENDNCSVTAGSNSSISVSNNTFATSGTVRQNQSSKLSCRKSNQDTTISLKNFSIVLYNDKCRDLCVQYSTNISVANRIGSSLDNNNTDVSKSIHGRTYDMNRKIITNPNYSSDRNGVNALRYSETGSRKLTSSVEGIIKPCFIPLNSIPVFSGKSGKSRVNKKQSKSRSKLLRTAKINCNRFIHEVTSKKSGRQRDESKENLPDVNIRKAESQNNLQRRKMKKMSLPTCKMILRNGFRYSKTLIVSPSTSRIKNMQSRSA